MFPPHYIKNATTGERQGWGVDLAHALAARIRVQARLVEYPGPDKLLEGLNEDTCDAGFLVNSPAWANAVDYSRPFLQQDFTFLLPPGSSIRSIADVDRPEVRIAVVRHHASTLDLARILRHAKMISADTLHGAFELLRDGQTNAFASTRPQLLDEPLSSRSLLGVLRTLRVGRPALPPTRLTRTRRRHAKFAVMHNAEFSPKAW
jgi:polar amino acid transport system substrate-binding protein